MSELLEEDKFVKLLSENIEFEQEIRIERQLLLEKAIRSDNPNSILKARQYIQGIQRSTQDTLKTFLVDPFETKSDRWKSNKGAINPGILKSMGQTPYCRAVIGTRIEQLSDFSEPVSELSKPGWIIRKRSFLHTGQDKQKITKQDQKTIEEITDFLYNCGSNISVGEEGQNFQWTKDVTFETFVRKFFKDSLELDAGCFEVGVTRNGSLSEFIAGDGGTIYIAEDYDSSNYSDTERQTAKKYGFYPSYVQVLQGQVVAEYYPWELCYGVRNPSTELRKNGYGNPELTSLIGTVTNLLNADAYNANFFKVGSHPKGILAVSGGLNQPQLDDFRMQWRNQVAGIQGSHKLPIVNSEKVNFINTQMGSKDMEFNEFFQFLIRLVCVLFKMSPVEVGLDQQGGSSLIQNNNTKEEISYSRQKGLKPLLRFHQRKVNKYLVQRKWKDFEFAYVGVEPEDETRVQDMDIKAIQNYQTINEVRKKRDLPPIEGGDIIANPIFFQEQQMKQQQGRQGGGFGEEEMGNEEEGGDNEQGQESQNPFEKSNPIAKNFYEYMDRLKWQGV